MAKEQQLQGTKQSAKQGAKRMTPKQRAARKRRNIIIFVAELFVLAIVVGVAWFVIRGTSVKHPNVDSVGVDTQDPNETLDLNPGQVNVNQNIYDTVKEPENPMSRYMQIALFGLDSRNKKLGSNPSRSDTNIIACIDTEKKEIKLVSVYRDTYLNLTNGSYNKCNGAYFAGGPTRAMTMLNMNLDLAITDYVTVGFWGLIDLIDALGGVWVDVTQAEIHYLNDYQISMVGTTTDGKNYTARENIDYTPVKEAGYQKLNGLQAVAYCRIRYIGNDYGRTERQRKVIAAMMDVAKNMSLADLTRIANSNIFNEFETSIKLDVILSMLGDIGEYKIVESCGFPDMNMLISTTIGAKGDCVIPLDLEKNVSKLHEILFGTEDYVPTATVREYSAEIKRQTQAYLP